VVWRSRGRTARGGVRGSVRGKVRGRLRAVALAGALTGLLALAAAVPSPAAAAPAGVQNGDLEQTTAGTPDCFSRSGWGTNTATWALTTAAHSGTVAQSLTVSAYTDGDRKLLISENAVCAPAVTPGTAYRLSVAYTSTSTRTTMTVFRHSAAGWTYWTDLTAAPATAAWAVATGDTPVVPAGTDQLTFGLSLAGNGTLVTDDYAMAPVGSATASPTPTGPTNPELSQNGGLEAGADPPTGWFVAGWGDAQVSAHAVTTAHSGSRAFSLTMAGRTQGDYKLLPTEALSPVVQPGSAYQLSAWYTSTTAAVSVTVFSHTAAGWGYWTDVTALPASAGWRQVGVPTPPVPAGVDAIAWGLSLAGNGTLVTDDYSTVLVGDAGPVTGPAAEGRWSVLTYQLPIRAVHATLLRTGKVLLLAGSGNDLSQFQAGTFRAALYDPVAGTFTTLAVPKDMFCSGHVTLPDGRVLIQGGTKSYPTVAGGADYGGLRSTFVFDPATSTFTQVGDANEGHWYPTLTELGNGDVWMAGGLKEDTTGAVNTESWDTAAGAWRPTGQVPQTWSYWGLYPHMFLLQDGRLFYSGGHVFGNGLPGTGSSLLNWQTATISDVSGLRQKDLRDQSASVLLPPAQDQKVMITGGGNINTNLPGIKLTDIIDLRQAAPVYQPGPDLPGDGKMYLNATVLPDRTVLVSNGGKYNRDNTSNVLTASIYDPIANAWTSVAADPIGRNYHSTALLLPDGRVAVFGSNPGDGTFELRISVYEPSYLFKGARPVLAAPPAAVGYGQQFGVAVQSSSAIKWAQLIRPMSVTHQMDSNMRLVDVPVTVTGGTATMTIPANRNLLPPGPYLLTVTDTQGVPSVAQWVTVR